MVGLQIQVLCLDVNFLCNGVQKILSYQATTTMEQLAMIGLQIRVLGLNVNDFLFNGIQKILSYQATTIIEHLYILISSSF